MELSWQNIAILGMHAILTFSFVHVSWLLIFISAGPNSHFDINLLSQIISAFANVFFAN